MARSRQDFEDSLIAVLEGTAIATEAADTLIRGELSPSDLQTKSFFVAVVLNNATYLDTYGGSVIEQADLQRVHPRQHPPEDNGDTGHVRGLHRGGPDLRTHGARRRVHEGGPAGCAPGRAGTMMLCYY